MSSASLLATASRGFLSSWDAWYLEARTRMQTARGCRGSPRLVLSLRDMATIAVRHCSNDSVHLGLVLGMLGMLGRDGGTSPPALWCKPRGGRNGWIRRRCV